MFSPVELAVFAAAGPAGAKGASYMSKLAIGGLKSGVARKASTEAGISTGKDGDVGVSTIKVSASLTWEEQ